MSELTTEQRITAEEMIAALTKALEVPPPPTQPAMNNGSLQLRAYDTYVQPGERMAYVPVALNFPPNQTMVFKCLTVNGTAVENNHFLRVEKYLEFQPGEQVKIVAIPLKKDLGGTQFKLTVGWQQNSPTPPIADGNAVITGDPALALNPWVGTAVAHPHGLMARPANMTLIFKEDFTDFKATDSGYLADGVTPCWRTRLSHGRTQQGNQEMGYYADASLNPVTTPYFLNANGQLVLQSQYFPNGVLDSNGNPIPCPWDIPNPFYYSSSIITTQRNMNAFRKGDYAEARMTMCNQEGSWPAFWMVASDLSWPSIELDMFEGFFSNPGTLAQVGTTVHWKNSSGTHSMFSAKLPQLGIDISLPHTWGVYWGDQVVFFCDNVPYFAVPDVFPAKDCYLKLDVTVGGLVGLPPNPSVTWPAQMQIDWVKVWR